MAVITYNAYSKKPLVFLYGPSVRSQPSVIKKESKTDILRNWEYAISDEKVGLSMTVKS